MAKKTKKEKELDKWAKDMKRKVRNEVLKEKFAAIIEKDKLEFSDYYWFYKGLSTVQKRNCIYAFLMIWGQSRPDTPKEIYEKLKSRIKTR